MIVGLILFFVLMFLGCYISDYYYRRRLVKKFNKLYPHLKRINLPSRWDKEYQMLIVYMFGFDEKGETECKRMLDYFNKLEVVTNYEED